MQCPNCGQELADESHCQSCPWEATTEAASANASESETAPQVEAASLPLAEATPQAADSPDDGLPIPPTEDVKQPATESAGPTAESTTERDKTLNREGKLEVIKQVSEKIDRQFSEMSASASDAGSAGERRVAQILEAAITGSQLRAGRDVNLHVGGPAESAPKSEDEKSLYDFTRPLPSRKLEYYQPHSDEVQAFVQQLREHRVLFLSSAFNEHTLDAAHLVIRGLAVSQEARCLPFDEVKTKNIDFAIQSLFDRKRDLHGESVIQVDALSTLARTFPDSILGSPAWADATKEDLREKGHFLVIIVDLDYAQQKKLHRETYPYWEVPFLRPFLEKHFPDQHQELETQILEQQKLCRWERNPTFFAQEVINYFYDDKLLAVVNAGGPKDPESSAAEMLEQSDEVEKVVLYTAAFFRDITAPEFRRVVAALLAKRTKRVTNSTGTANGNSNALAVTEAVPLTESWEKDKDIIFDKLLRETSSGNESMRTVSLSESGLREPLRRLFEKRRRFYLIDQFKILQESGIFFYPSIRLAENTTRIAVDLAQLYPDEFDESWIVGMVLRLRQYFASDLLSESDDLMFQFLQSSEPAALNVAFARIADVCRGILESPQQKNVVPNSLEHLIKSGHHEEVLWLIKQLRFSSELDVFYWLRQLLHRADVRTRRLTYYYLLSYLKRLGKDVYDGLMKIEAWLPEDDRETYTQFHTFVFQILIQYCLETVGRFDARQYGKWPSRYPLFAIKDELIAATRTTMLARWLLHPGIALTLTSLRIGGTQMTLIGALLAEWSFILLGNRATPWSATSEYSAAFLFNQLFRQFATSLDLFQRLELLKFWNGLEHDLLKAAGQLSMPPASQQELRWKRKLVRELIEQLRKVPRPAKLDRQIQPASNLQPQSSI